MGSSYYITYGGNRLTFPGATGSVAWEFEHPMVVVDPLGKDYLSVEFHTPAGETITLESQQSSASARIPVGSTALWTASGISDDVSARNLLTSLYLQGFSGYSSDVALGTANYMYDVTGRGSALLTANSVASVSARTYPFYLCTYGEGGTAYYSTLSASGLLPGYTGSWGTVAGRGMWVPEGSDIGFSASSQSGKTYSIQPGTTHAFDSTGIAWSHTNPGTNMLFTGVVTGAAILRLGSGRQKLAYATGYNRMLAASQGLISAAAWQSLNIITSFSSNMCSGGEPGSYIAGSANAGKIRGFASSTKVGVMKNSAGTWSNVTSSTNTYKWENRYFINNSAHVTATFSAVRSKGPTGNNKATYVFFGHNSAGNRVSRLSAQFALPTQSGKTATKTASGNFSTTHFNEEAYTVLSNTVAQSTALYANSVGYFTASGQVQ